MNIYIKVLKLITPYWKALVLSLVLTFMYVVFNNVSLWISVDFIRELFEPNYGQTEQVSTEAESASRTREDHLQKMFDVGSEIGLYQKINYQVKSLLLQENKYDTLKVVCLIIFLAFLFKNIAHYLHHVLLNYIEIRIVVNLRDNLHKRLLFLPLRFFEKRHSGFLTSIVFNDVNAINQVLNRSFGKMILSPIQILTNIGILILISWELSLITFLVVPFSTIVIVKIGQSMRRRSRKVFRQIADVVANFQEAISAIRIVKAFTSEDKEIERFSSSNYQWFRKLFRANQLKFATSPINEILFVLILVFLLWYGGNMVYSKSGLSAEDFIRFLVFLFTMFQPIKDLSGINNVIQTGLAAAERIFDVLETDQEIYEKPDSVALKTLKNEIRFEEVSFRYDEDNPEVLKNVNLTIPRGKMVAFVGHSGSGKTTLINLLPRFYEILKGKILIDGTDIRDYTLWSLRKQMGIVTQDTVLFNDTVRGNIAYGLDECSEEAIIEAAKTANAWEFIKELPQGLDTHIGEKGIRLSGGQKQRLSIARAVLKNPPILILDEATSALDTESERLVQEAIDNLLKSRTVLVIAHRLSTITNAGMIVVMNQGEIIDTGTNEELLEKSEIYKNLSQQQFIAGVTQNV